MPSLNKTEMAQLPESLTELREFCSNCGRVLGKGGSYVKATIEQISSEGEMLRVDYDKRHFCEDCMKGGIYINVKDPDVTDAP